MNTSMTWKDHVEEVCGKANRTIGFVKRNLNISAPRIKDCAYKTLVRPQLEYASSVWDPYHQKDINRIEWSNAEQPDMSAITTEELRV
jgi:hypothetical protein